MAEEQEHIGRDPYAEWLALNAFNAARHANSSLNDEYLSVFPIDGTTDDWPRLMNTILPAAIAANQIVVMRQGLGGQSWQFKTTEQVPSEAQIQGTPETRIVLTNPASTAGDTPFTLNPGTLSETIALATDALAGETSIASPTSFAAGSIIVLSTTTAKQTMRYKVLSVTGSGPFTLVLDRPIAFTGFTVANGTTISLLTGASENVSIDGRGMVVTGTHTGGLVDFSLGYRCTIKNVVFDCTGLTLGAGGVLFAACLESTAERITVISPAALYGVEGQSCESTLFARVRVSGSTNDGIVLAQTVLHTLDLCIGDTSAKAGAHVSGCLATLIRGGAYNANGFPLVAVTGAIRIDLGSIGTKVIGATCNYNAIGGVYLDSSVTAVADTFLDDLDLRNNGNSLVTNAGVLRLKATNIDGTGCGSGANIYGDTLIENFTSGGGAGAGFQEMTIQPAAGQITTIRGLRLTVTTTAVGINRVGAGLLRLEDAQISLTVATTAFQTQATTGVSALRDVTIDGAGATGSTGINIIAGASVRLGANVNADACTTPVTIASGAFTSRGQFTATSTTPVSVAFADLKSTDRVTTKVHTLGTVTVNPPEPLIIQTAGVGFTATSIATDTSVYDYTIL